MVVFLSGCGSTIIEGFDFEEKSLLTDAKVRTVVSRDVDGRRIVCAEPSPDALVAVAQAASAQAQVAGKGAGGISFSLSESAASIGIRTATIQLLRDGLYRACEAYANGAIDNFGYALILNKIDDVMVTLLGIEGLTRIPPATQVAIGTESSSSFEGSQETEKGEDGKPKSQETKGEGESKAKAIAAVFKELQVTKHDAQAMSALSGAITNLAKKDRPGSSVAGACLMWLSSNKDFDVQNPRHQEIIGFCDQAFRVASRAAKFEALARSSASAKCLNWLTTTKAEDRDAEAVKQCSKFIGLEIKAQAEAEAKAKVEAQKASLVIKQNRGTARMNAINKAKADAKAKKDLAGCLKSKTKEGDGKLAEALVACLGQ